MIISRICVNCAHGAYVGNEQQALGVVCRVLPLELWKEPGATCSRFAMAENPPYVEPGAPGGQEMGEPGPEPMEGQDMALEALPGGGSDG